MIYPGGRYVTGEMFDYQGIDPQTMLVLAYLKSKLRVVKRYKKMWLAAADGDPRSGKTLWLEFLGHCFDPTFLPNFRKRMVQSENDFMDAMDSIGAHKWEGAAVVIDEAGVTASSARWYDKWNTMLAETVQTAGYLHPIILFASPRQDFIDSRLRKMFNAYFYIRRYSNDESIISPYELTYSSTRKKQYTKNPKIRLAGSTVKLTKIHFGCPPDFFLKLNQDYDQSIKEPLRQRIKNVLMASRFKEQEHEFDIDKQVDTVVKSYQLFESKRSNPAQVCLDQIKIEYGLKMTPKQAKYVKGKAEDKIKAAVKAAVEGKHDEGNV